MAEEFAHIKSQQEKLLHLRGMGPGRRPPRRGMPPREGGRGRGASSAQSQPASLVPYGDDDDKVGPN